MFMHWGQNLVKSFLKIFLIFSITADRTRNFSEIQYNAPVNLRMNPRVLAVAFMVLFAAAAEATELRVRIKGPNSTPARIEKAEVLLVGWGWTERIPLPFADDVVRIAFDSPAMRTQVLDRFPNLETAFIHIQAQDLTPIVSEPFAWPGSKPQRNLSAIGVDEIRVDFRDKRIATVKESRDQELTVELKRPSLRQIRIVDDLAKPVSGLKVAAFMFWSNDNHCGRMSGADLLMNGVTDSEGKMTVPDGDFEYAFQLLDGHIRFTMPDAGDTTGYIILRLTSRETQLWVHQYSSRPLTLRVFSGDTPLAGVIFNGASNTCSSCHTCGGPVQGATDTSGTLAIERFYPEDFDTLCLLTDNGATLWQTVTRKLGINPIDVRLPAGTSPPKHMGLCPPEPLK